MHVTARMKSRLIPDEECYTRAVPKISSHSEYLENRSRGLDVTWQPVREDLTVHP
jgi:hypothetical protein